MMKRKMKRKKKKKKKKIQEYIYLNDTYSEESYGSNYSSTEYIYNNYTFNETGLYKI